MHKESVKIQEGGYVCLPLRCNVPVPNKEWKLTICPICGAECWETPLAKEIISKGYMSGCCTLCALKAGTKTIDT